MLVHILASKILGLRPTARSDSNVWDSVWQGLPGNWNDFTRYSVIWYNSTYQNPWCCVGLYFYEIASISSVKTSHVETSLVWVPRSYNATIASAGILPHPPVRFTASHLKGPHLKDAKRSQNYGVPEKTSRFRTILDLCDLRILWSWSYHWSYLHLLGQIAPDFQLAMSGKLLVVQV